MSSVSASQVPALVSDVGYKIAMESYASADPAVWPILFDTIPLTGEEEGFSARTIVGTTEPAVTRRGADAPARTMEEGYQWYGKVDKLQEAIILPEELWKSPNAKALIEARIKTAIPGLSKGFMNAKERMAVRLFNKGAMTAGDLVAFDGNFPGHVDPYPKFIYDGKPWFAASGNGHPAYLKAATTFVNHDANTLSSSSLTSAYTLHTVTNARSEADEFVGGNIPNTLVVPADLRETALVLLGTMNRPGTANNDINVNRDLYNLVVWPWLTDTNGWFLGRAKEGIKAADSGAPMIFTSEPDPRNGNITVRLVSYFGAWVDQFRPWSAHATSTS